MENKLEELSLAQIKSEFPISRIRNDFYKEVTKEHQTIFDKNGENPQEFILAEDDDITLISIQMKDQVLPFNEFIELEFLIGIGKFNNRESGIYEVEKAFGKMYYNQNLQFRSLDLFYDNLHLTPRESPSRDSARE